MALPKWITPAGNLGTVPELEYYQFPLDAYDASGGTLVYSRISGRLPLGIQVVPTGLLQGIPISELGGDTNVSYQFTIRVKNTSTNEVADRTFSISITNVAPPIIIPRNVNLGVYLDGTIINQQLVAIESTPGATLIWRVTKGTLPDGLVMDSSGLISGYLYPIYPPTDTVSTGWGGHLSTGSYQQPDWVVYDTVITPYSLYGWDFPPHAIGKTFEFTVEVYDGVNYDTSTYSLRVFPKNSLTADNNELTIDVDLLSSIGMADTDGNKHDPIITTTQSDLVDIRQGSYLSFQITADDLDGDALEYSVPVAASGAFDEQDFTVTNSITYIATPVVGGDIYAGMWPRVDIATTLATLNLFSGNTITANVGDYITQSLSSTNARVISTATNSNSILLEILNNNFITGKGNIAVNGTELVIAAFNSATSTWANTGVVPSTVITNEPTIIVDTTRPELVEGDIIKVIDTANKWREATVTDYTTLKLSGNTRVTGSVGANVTQTGSTATAVITAVSASTGKLILQGNLITANVGDFITQGGANATITSNVVSSSSVPVNYTAGNFVAGSSNVSINGTSIDSYPIDVICSTNLSVQYTGSLATTGVFKLNVPSNFIFIAAANTANYPTSVVSVGVTLGALATEGTIGFDEGKFDQGSLSLPAGLSIDINTGWLTGVLPTQTINELTYDFEVLVKKRDYPEYNATRLYNLTVLGDLNNRINWITPTDLGTIKNGQVSDLSVSAVSTKGKPLYYKLSNSHRVPQGLIITSDGLLSGRVSFELFGLDATTTTIDGGKTTFDNTYQFTVTASDYDRSISADKTFKIRIINRDDKPFEDLYVKAFLSQEQRNLFKNLMTDRSIFPSELIYRNNDPFFGLAKEIKSLFLSGLNPSDLADYMAAVDTNHFNKRVEFVDIKTAVALDNNFNVKYEVVYIEIKDENTNALGKGPAELTNNAINLNSIISNPYYDSLANRYSIAYPNAFSNMKSVVAATLGYENKGALPDWMTSKQPNGRILGFTRAVVLAYTVPGASSKIAYRLQQRNFNWNQLDFTVDRYELDNSYTQNFNVSTQSFISADETTFDRYPSRSNQFTPVTTLDNSIISNVDYAVSTAFEDINKKLVANIKANGGLDGYKNFKAGDLLVFAQQEFFRDQNDIGEYDQGWSNVQSIWDNDQWDYDSDLTDNPYQYLPYAPLVYTVTWTPNTLFFVGWTVVYGGTSYRVNATYYSGATFAIEIANSGNFDNYDTAFDMVGFEQEDPFDALTELDPIIGPNLTPGLGWDAADYVPGYNEHNLDPGIPNKRIGIWQINIDSNDVVTLSFLYSVQLNNTLYVKKGFTYGGTNIYYDPTVKTNLLIPNYSIIPQQIKTTYTTFDGNGTRFLSNRDSYTVPGSRDKYIKFAKLGVFN